MDRAAEDPALQPLIVLRVVIRSPDLETFVNKYSRFIKDDRIFIFTKSSQPSGTRVRFTLELADGQPLIHGEGTVTRIRPDSGDPSKPPGMELRFVPLDASSGELVARMLAARELTGRMPDQQTAPIITGTDSQPIAIAGRFRDESTDVDDKLLPPPLPPRPKVIDSHPVLEPLQKTGNYDAIAEAEAQPRQDESGAVTLAQGGPMGARGADEAVQSGGFTSPDGLPAGVRQMPSAPSLPSPSLPPLSPPPPPLPSTSPPFATASASIAPTPTPSLAQLAKASEERPSGNFSTPTPLPMPIPAGPSDDSAHLSSHLSPTRLDKLSAVPRDDGTGGFAAVGPAPPFAEAFRAPLAAANGHAPHPNGTVPANPFSEVSDGAIEYFVEWSMEQSTAPKPKAAASSFANVAMATPRRERRRSAVRPLLLGTLVGLLFGVPIGGFGMWLWKPAAQTVIVEHMPESRPAEAPIAPEPSAPIAPSGAVPSLPTPPVNEAPKPMAAVEKPKAATEKPIAATTKPPAAEKPKAIVAVEPKDESETEPVKVEKQTLQKEQPKAEIKTEAKVALVAVQIGSHPSGAAISVDGEARGKTPSTLQLAPGTHEVTLTKERYATATQTVDAPGKLDVTLRRPTATLHVDSDPPGGDVTVEGKPRGKAPVDITLEAFHHYEVAVSLLGTKPFHKRVALKPPQVDVNVKLEVVHK